MIDAMAALNLSTISWIDQIRRSELDFIVRETEMKSGRLLDIGGGTGAQALALQSMGLNVDSIDLAGSSYREARVFPIVEYDGYNIPFPDASFDLLYSSNVLEHVAHLDEFQQEMLRVLKPGGRAIHIMPSSTWRAWTMVAHYPSLPLFMLRRKKENGSENLGATGDNQGPAIRALRLAGKIAISDRHGERGNRFTEVFFFRAAWWRRSFERAGWAVERIIDVPLFYTGNNIFGRAISLDRRRKLARLLGAASNCFILRKPIV